MRKRPPAEAAEPPITPEPEDPCAPENPPEPQPFEESSEEKTVIQETQSQSAGQAVAASGKPEEVGPRSAEQRTLASAGTDSARVMEAALFMGNRPFSFAELALVSKTTVKRAHQIAAGLQKDYEKQDGAIEIVVNAQEAFMQVRPGYLSSVSQLSENVELSRKSMRILALIAKKGKLVQSELRKYFRGDIYAYITELKDLGYVSSEKKGNSRLLRPTSKFHETFQLADLIKEIPPVPEPPAEPQEAGDETGETQQMQAK